MSQIFVSYARQDRRRVQGLVDVLEDRGWSVFWDRKIPAGKTWDTFLGAEVSSAECVVVVWTEHSVQPEREWVREEAQEGKRRGVLIPVRLDPVTPPWGFRLVQTADLAGWKGDRSAPELHRLLADIAALVTPRTAASGEIWAKPGEKVVIGIYEERDANGSELAGPRRVRVAENDQPLPPTSKPGHWWTKV